MTTMGPADSSEGFAGFRCWTPTWTDETVSVEAVTSSPDVFLATHRPLLIARTPVRADEQVDRSRVDVVSEQDVLRDFVERKPVNGVLIMPVVGQSGTGKSHLVRWIREQMPARPDRRVIYIEKTNTNLSGVVKALLMDLEGEEFDAIRAEVDKVVTDYDERRLPGELLTQLALSIEFSSVDEKRPDARYRRALVGSGRLSSLLLDNVMYSRLVADDGVIARLAKELQQGRANGDPERRFGFEVEDFPLHLVEITAAGASARQLMQQLVASEDLLATAVQLLNENLDQAVLRLANLTGGKLQGAMLDIRRALKEKGQEIVLLVEDFAVIQGVQRDLLDAITEVGVREGRAELAPIRTLMAVTRGYFDALAETVTTRAAAGIPYLYDLDMSLGESDAQVNGEHIRDFTARYLNAARLGRDALERSRSSAVDSSSDWVPNACEPCPFRVECHASFGASTEGHGLYPFNANALGRTVRSRSSTAVFNPRAVLGRVVRPVLESYYEDIHEGNFPPVSFSRAFPLSPRDRPLLAEVVQVVKANDPTDHGRRVVLLEYWGGAPAEPGNLADGIHTAFKLPRVASFRPISEGEDDDGDGGGGGGGSAELPLKVVRARTAIENWFGRQEVLPQEVARNLRTFVSNYAQKRISWNDELLSEASKEEMRTVLRDRLALGVRIEGAAGEGGLQEAGPATIRIARNEVMATLLGAIVMREHLGHWNFPGGPGHARRLQGLADEWAAKIVAGVRLVRGADEAEVTASAVSVSLLSALALGMEGARSREHADLVRAMFDDGQSLVTLGDADLRPREWTDLTARLLAARPTLVGHLRGLAGAAQGTGQVQLVDVDKFLPYVKTAASDVASVDVPANAPAPLLEASRPLSERLATAVAAQWTAMTAWADDVLPAFGDGSQAAEVLKELESALQDAVKAGLYAGGRAGPAETQQEVVRQAKKYAWSALDNVRDALTLDPGDAGARLREAAVDRGRSFGLIQQLANSSHAWLDASLGRANARVRDEAPDGGVGLVDLLNNVDRIVYDLGNDAVQAADSQGERSS